MTRTILDADTLRTAMVRLHESLTQHRDELNSLNVYPVPDGDTGTNMLLTQQAVRDEVASLSGADLMRVGEAVSRAALMGARGNSGVILAQVLRGLCEALGRAEPADGEALAAGLDRAAEEGYRAVAQPEPGTMLTVLADASGAARGRAREGGSPADVAEAALEEARASLGRTTESNPVLRAARVVDAGGKGVVLLIDALVAALADRPLTEPVGAGGPVGVSTEAADLPGATFQYEVQYLLSADDTAVPALRERLAGLGDSIVIVGGQGMFKVHVHTDSPTRVEELGRAVGTVDDVGVVDLRERVTECLVGQARAVHPTEQAETALVAVVEGEGLVRIFRSLGALVVPGGAGRNLSVGELLDAVVAAPASAVVVVPNHRNVIPAAEQAATTTDRDVRVIRSESIPEGLAAAAAFNPLESIDENVQAMSAASREAAAVEITRAVRDAPTPAGDVRSGDAMAFIEGVPRVVAGDPATIAVKAVSLARKQVHEVLTILIGADADDEEAAAVERALRDAYPALEIEVHRGDQPAYPYLIGLE